MRCFHCRHRNFRLTRPIAIDSDGPETSLERARAARRAAAAAVKLVASASALASLETVELNGLTGEERSKSYSFYLNVHESHSARLHYLLQRIWHPEPRRLHRVPSAAAKV